MAVDLYSGMRFRALLVRVGETFGLVDFPTAGGARTVPEDADDLDRLKRAVTRGYDRFLRADPDWTFCSERFSLTLSAAGTGPYNIDGSAYRYRLPAYLEGPPSGGWRYTSSSVPARTIQTVSHRRVLEMAQGTDTTGVPLYAGHFNGGDSGDPVQAKAGPELVLYPSPGDDYAIEADFRVRNHLMADLDERHIAGRDHDAAICAACIYEMALEDEEDQQKVQRFKDDWLEELALSKALDGKRRTRIHGILQDAGNEPVRVNRWTNLGTLTVNGTAI